MKELIDLLKTIFDERTVASLVLLGLAIPVLWVVYKFFVEGIQNSIQRYYELKIELYKEIAQVTSVIATSMKEEEIQAAAFRFDELYWGQLVLVEDRAVESALISFRSLIARGSSAELEVERLTKLEINRASLRNASLAVAHACFNSLQPRWQDQIKASFRSSKKGTGN
jgi:hypothetical protein